MTTSGIARSLAPSEAMFTGNQLYVGYSVRTSGDLNLEALDAAYQSVIDAYPVLAARIDTTADGDAVIVTSDARPQVQVGGGDLERGLAGADLDQQRALSGLTVVRDGAQSCVTLATHHSIADAYHSFGVLEALWARYTDIVDGAAAELACQPYPKSVEQLLAERGIEGGVPESPAADLAAEQLPPQPPATEPVTLAMARHRLTAEETAALAALGHRERVTINGLLSGAVLLAQAELREKPLAELIYVYPVNLRTRLTPQIGLTEGTNVLGFATFQAADVEPEAVAVGREVCAQLHAGLAEGSIQRSALQLSDAQAMARAGEALGDGAIVMTNWGPVPALRSPGALRLTDFRGTFHARVAPDAPTQPAWGSAFLVSTFDGRLSIELPQLDNDPLSGQRAIDALREQLNRLLSRG
ncbi:phthiocerol/phthiodiolone dimycocerosyl transferase family protein [Nocardia transvalensis]|uniref:phthiocerol/phthiodiolone dimycocerosyl transferase family protein n=1 Tax=Nocardia transvalensis TaxID=37333 RepID=UPI00189433E6|nr:acyltransferase [Nocardia transvalensis]MBF6331220.1 acyltransferase [Nocardia transvalensis]